MQIAQYKLSSPVILAPMAGITDVFFRSICIDKGAGLAVTEMVSSDTTLFASDKTLSRLAFEYLDSQIRSVQIVGSDPHNLAEAAKYNVKLGADIIDINMGCPAKKVCRKLAGSALLCDPSLVRKILRTVVSAVDVPITLKIRTGTDKENRNGVLIAKIAQEEGVQAIAVHGRTRADKFGGQAEYETIKQVKQTVQIPVIANGDIRSGPDAAHVLSYTGADAVMVGRASQGNPWIFEEINRYLQMGENRVEVNTPDIAEIHETIVRHLLGLYKIHGELRGVRVARKHISWYCRDQRGAAVFRQKINKAESTTEQLKLLDRFFSSPNDLLNEPKNLKVSAA